MSTSSFNFSELSLSQVPALRFLVALGYRYLSPDAALAERGGKTSNVLLEGILRTQLAVLNRIHYRGSEYHFSEANIQEAVQKLKNIKYDGLVRTNQAVYDLVTLGTSLEQSVEGVSRSSTFNYVDWNDPSANVFHVVPEFSVERSRSTETVRPDIVLFVNGIPFVVIECKSSSVDVSQGVSQHIRNQGEDYIPGLFIYAQLLLAVNKNSARYGTVKTPSEFWSVWQELEDSDKDVASAVKDSLSDKCQLPPGEFAGDDVGGDRSVTGQDAALYSLCRPERLLDLVYRFYLV